MPGKLVQGRWRERGDVPPCLQYDSAELTASEVNGRSGHCPKPTHEQEIAKTAGAGGGHALRCGALVRN